MGNFMRDIVICVLLLLSVSIIFGTSEIIKSFTNNGEEILKTSVYNSIVRLCLNLLGYATVLLPGYLIYKYVRYTKYIQKGGKGCIPKLVHSCFMGHCETGLLDSPSYIPNASAHVQRTFKQDALLLIYCFIGLQVSYLTWGYLQEKIMTQEYEDASGNKARFQDSQFLVFVNRILAFLMSGLYLLIRRQPQHKTPLYKYAFCSLSNIMSSWCQYEALKYVSFPTQIASKYIAKPAYIDLLSGFVSNFALRSMYAGFAIKTQAYCGHKWHRICLEFLSEFDANFVTICYQIVYWVLAKASKIIPVMIMGKIVSRTTYEYYEYVTAILISIGMTLFMLDSSDYKNDGVTTLTGIILLGGYLVLDSFTSTWQNALFVEYNATSIQMMCAVNMFSCLLTAMSLFQQSSFPLIFSFMTTYPRFIIDCLLISICSTSGQLYIFYTISKFGPVTFVIMMTIRQGLAILLSCLLYHHKITIIGIFGILLVFSSVFLRIYCNNRLRAIRRRRTATNSIKH